MMPSDSTMMSRIFQCLRFFNLGNDLCFTFLFFKFVAKYDQVFYISYKGKRHPIQFLFNDKIKIYQVFFCQCRQCDLCIRKLIPFFEESVPPRVTTTFTSLFFSMLSTVTSSLPSSIMMMLPIFTSL